MTAKVELGIDAWVRGLAALGEEDFARRATRYMIEHPVEPESLERYTFFEKDHYTRNLVFKNALFEVLTLCWERGQKSAIHNHRDQQCWMVMGFGCLENINYRVADRDPARGTCKLFASGTRLITRSSPMAVDDDEPVHRVVNCPDRDERAVSIHIYSRPFDTCEVYFADGTYRDVQLSYWSQYGERC